VRIERVRATAAFLVLVSHAHSFDPDEPAMARQFAEDYLNVAGRVPVYSLRYHPDVGRLAEVIDEVSIVAADLGVVPVHQEACRAPAVP
jgi:hypothetical protein